MNILKKAYYYLFYKLYKFWEYVSVPKFWSDWKAGLSLIILEIWILVSLLIYYKLYFNLNANIVGSKKQWIASVIILVIIDYIIFHRTNQWKDIAIKFDQLPKRKNIIGSWIVFGMILLIIINFIFSFYLYYNS